MKRFTRLYTELDATTRTNEKIAALVRYFEDVESSDAAWALYFLSGRRFRRAISTRMLLGWAGEEAGITDWLIDACREAVGDSSETITLLLPDREASTSLRLTDIVEQYIRPLQACDEATARAMIVELWRLLSRQERFIYHKVLSGAFRVGVQRRLLVRALAAIDGVDVEPAVIEHRLTGPWTPTAGHFTRLLDAAGNDDLAARPYPFFLASPLESEIDALGLIDDWIAEWKWDGVRAQMIRRERRTVIWSRGEEILDESFPELVLAGESLPDGTVLDGEVLAWEDNAPLSFNDLQRRLNRRQRDLMLFPDVPVLFQAYDLLERDGVDLREQPLIERRRQLDAIVTDADDDALIRRSPILEVRDWNALVRHKDDARAHGVEGVMIKRRESPYRVGRVRGDWWKLKIDPFHIDAVLIYAQPGSGRRASLYTDYTFGVWDDDELVPVAKAYSGLTDDEIDRVDAFVRANTTERFGPLRAVTPTLVFELAFEAINESTRHRSGIALRFPRMHRWRDDKPAGEAGTIEELRALMSASRRSTS